MTEAARTTLYFVRHGEAESNRDQRFGGHSPAALTELGQRQAVATAAAIAALRPTTLITSDLVRAAQTAAPIAVACGLEALLEPRLRERSVGVFDGLTFADAEAQFPDEWRKLMARDPAAVPAGGETTDVVFARVSAAVEDLVERYRGGRIVVVTHGLAMFHVFALVCGFGSPNRELPVFVLVDNCSVSHFEHRRSASGEHRWRIMTLNDTAHLRVL